MSFDVNNLEKRKRIFMTETDLRDAARCQGCKVLPICGGWGDFDDSRWCSKECDYCRAICCRHPKAQQIVRSIGGLGIMNVEWKPFETDLPPVIPQLNAHAFDVAHPAYGISAKKLYYPDSGGWSKEKDLKARFKVPQEAKLVISFSVKDIILDSWLRDLDMACARIAEYNFDYAIAMNFSMYDNYPPFDRLVNLRRQYFTMERLQEHGVKVIPGIGYVRAVDLERQAEWCRKNRPPLVSLNMTTMRNNPTHKAWKHRIDTLERFREKCGYPIRFLLTGASGPKRLQSLVARLDGLHFYDTKTYRFAEFHRKVWDYKWDKAVPVGEMFFNNLEYATWLYETTEEEKQMPQAATGGN